jgi:DNA-binding transcriptional LysR family regulator
MNGSLDLMASFLALAEELHFTRAAERLHVAQPALTKRIQQFEEALGLVLFTRTRRSVRLTAAGELLLPSARHALAAASAFDTAAGRLRDGEIGRLRIGFSPSAPHHVLPLLMRAFRRRHPGIECVLTEVASDAQIEHLTSGDLDVGILRPPASLPRGVVCTTFFEEPFVAVLPRDHRLASRRTVPLTALAGEPFVLIARRVVAAVHDQAIAACAAAGFTPRVAQEATHIHAVVGLVAAGCGVSILPASAARLGVQEIVSRPLGKRAPRTAMAIAHLAQAPAAALALAKEARQRFAAL